MRIMEVSILAVIFVFVTAMTISQNRAKERRERLRVIEEALRSGNLDAGEKQELMSQLTGRRPRRRETEHEPRHAGAKFVFGIGWLGLFTGIALMTMGGDEPFQAGVFTAALSFALVSLPLALRELDGRQKSKSRA
jgi:hypothetical protein